MNATSPIWILVVAIVISSLPFLLCGLTCYLKISVVLGLLRNAFGAGQMPGAVVTSALALVLTLRIMSPVINQTFEVSSQIDFAKLSKVPNLESLDKLKVLVQPWRAFLEKNAGRRELVVLAGDTEISPEQSPLGVLLPAFLLSELKQAFAMGFVLLLPFLLIDLLVSNILAAMGMFMVSPPMIALPIKIFFFVISDGWLVLATSLIDSYGD